MDEVVVVDTTNPGGTPLAVIPTGSGTTPAGLAIRKDNSRVYVALNGTDQLLVIDNTLPTPAPIAAAPVFNLDPTTNQPIDVPVDCGTPHAMEITGTVNLAEKFPGAVPAEPDQDGFIKDSCTKMTDAYLAPIKLRTTTLTLIYPTLSLPNWSAGSREVACSIGATLGNGGWATLVNSAKGQLLINGQPPVPPPDIPEERLTLPLIPLQVPLPSAPPDAIPPNNQHLPQQQPVVIPTRAPASQAPATQAPQDAPPPADGGAPSPASAPEGPPPVNPVPEAPPPAPAQPAPGG